MQQAALIFALVLAGCSDDGSDVDLAPDAAAALGPDASSATADAPDGVDGDLPSSPDGGSTPSLDAAPYFDDTHLSIDGYTAVEDLSTHQPEYVRYQWETRNTALDIRGGAFVVANSRNDDGSACDTGNLPINLYPLNVYYGDSVAVVGGIMYSDISLDADWLPLYCNSAAVLFKSGAHSGIVDGMRITGAWDAIRPALDCPGLVVINNWISGVRDDVVENDDLYSMEFRDNLVDGTFQGISIRDDANVTDHSAETVKVSANVIRIQNFLYKGSQKFGALFKRVSNLAPRTKVYNTVVAIDSTTDSTFAEQWASTWASIADCSNNELLWLSDAALPSGIHAELAPACFTIHVGQEARDRWATAKANWINCHPRLQRLDTDPVSTPTHCVPNQFGGFGN